MDRKKIYKKAMAWIAMLGILTGIFAGCLGKSKDGGDQWKDGERAKGRYLEKEIILPENLGQPVGLTYQEDKIVLYTYASDEDLYQSYTYENGKWSEMKEQNWLADGQKRLGQEIVDVFNGRDGDLYARTQSPSGSHLLKAGETDTAEDITPGEDQEESILKFSDVAVLTDRTIGLGDYEKTMVTFYKDGKQVFSTEGVQPDSEDQVMLEVNEQTVAVVGKDGTSIEFYEAGTFEKKNTVELEQQFGEGFLISGTDKNWYLVNKAGIYRITEDGSISERIMDGANGMMSNDITWYMRRFIMGDEMEFYGLYSNAKQEWKLMHYVFDEDAPTILDQKLSSNSLQENRTVTQAVHEFKSKYPEVQIEYLTAVTGEEKPTADHIRTLNTELLSGSGADVLILDGLPMDAYIDKGVLRDLTDVVGKLKKSGVLDNIVEQTIQKDGKIYALPARVSIPIIYGTREEVRACESMDSLDVYVKEHTDKRLFGATSHDLVGMTLFHMFYDELQEENGTLDEEKICELLEIWMQICENGDFREYEEKYFDGESIWYLLDSSFCSAQEVIGESTYANVTELKGLSSSQTPYTIARKTGTAPQSYKEYYVPKTIAGINSSSKQTELAEKFVECLFSESVQETDSWDGLPVLRSVLETYPDYVGSPEGQKDTMSFEGINYETREKVKVTLSYPTKNEMEDLIKRMEQLSSPFIQDRVISDTVQQEMEKCYTGKQSPGKTAEAICQKIDIYLAE